MNLDSGLVIGIVEVTMGELLAYSRGACGNYRFTITDSLGDGAFLFVLCVYLRELKIVFPTAASLCCFPGMCCKDGHGQYEFHNFSKGKTKTHETGYWFEDIKRNRKAEAMHGRVAMPACVRYLAQRRI